MLFVMPGPKKTSTRKAKIVFELQLLHPQVDAEFHSDPKAGGLHFSTATGVVGQDFYL